MATPDAVATAYPLSWPEGWDRTPQGRRRNSDYSVGFTKARDELLRELRRMGARHIVISTNAPAKPDGTPYANPNEPHDPGVAVYWVDRKGARKVIACDHWRKLRDNVRACGLAIVNLRGLERCGASQILDRAFLGFAALQSGDATPWRVVLGFTNEFQVGLHSVAVMREMIEASYKWRAVQLHPDRGGSHEAMVELNRAHAEAIAELAAHAATGT